MQNLALALFTAWHVGQTFCSCLTTSAALSTEPQKAQRIC